MPLQLIPENELGAAASGHPDAGRVVAPSQAANANAVADLTGQGYAIVRVGGAAFGRFVLRLAQHARAGGRGSKSEARVAAEDELGAAAVVDPDAVLVEAPVVTAHTLAVADLTDELDAVAGVDRTARFAVVLRLANDAAAQRSDGDDRAADLKLGAAPVVDPDLVAVARHAPAPAEDAGVVAELL